MADAAYIRALVTGPRFKKQALDDLSEAELEQLRFTLTARSNSQSRKVDASVPAENRPF
jgi:pyruvate formate-lyase activating enzyme-like uncharacterized protein